ncbi:MAG: GTP 3',8-cyclase MoaA [Acidimicrobiia bacterium]|nr:GTP 3',8-cyclase MoaA [Acidimicrobiia bacterium]
MTIENHDARTAPDPAGSGVTDTFSRPLKDLRISVTDRCNFRCRYCMPKEIFNRDYEFLERGLLLSFEEIHRVVGVFAGLGVNKIRITGGEPLLRRNVEDLISMVKSVEGINDVTLTTNASLLQRKAQSLANAGLDRITVSLDSLDNEVFMAMNDVGFSVDDVLAGIDAAGNAGLAPIKINMVVQKGVNDHTVVDMARHFKGTGHIVRYIEYMDVGTTNHWCMDDVVPGKDIVTMISEAFPLEPADPNYTGEVASRWKYADGTGEIGVITSVTQPFCATCTRARISAEGSMYTCLFASEGTDLRSMLRAGATDQDLIDVIRSVWIRRDDRYSQLRSSRTAGLRKVEMSYIGG